MFDFRHPDYIPVFEERLRRLAKIRADPESLPLLKLYYKDHLADFINDWGITIDPKAVERGLPALLPFILFPKQREWVDWVVNLWKNQLPGLTEKTRQMGLSWLSMSLGCTMCLFHDGMVVGVGSRKQEYIDIIGDPKSLIEKGRIFMRHLPVEFRGGWKSNTCAPHMRLMFPKTGSILAGEAGDNIGRGNTTSIYFVDESAFLEHPTMVEASLSQTTNCRVDISTPNGLGNSFAIKRFSGKVDVFTIHWTNDPRKDVEWYAKQVAELDAVTVASEIDINYSASVEGVLIPSAWVVSAMDAHLKLQIPPSGLRAGALDIADEGKDKNAFCGAHGVVIEIIEEWSGVGDDIFSTVQRAFNICDRDNYDEFRYDADGMGAGVRGDARVINSLGGRKQIQVDPYRGSGPVHNPDGSDVKGRLNKDFFANAKAQAWWGLRTRFQKTHRWVVEGVACSPDEIISIPSKIPNAMKLMSELSQPTYAPSLIGKIVVDKRPEGTQSPNLADALVIRFAPLQKSMKINVLALQKMNAMSGIRR